MLEDNYTVEEYRTSGRYLKYINPSINILLIYVPSKIR